MIPALTSLALLLLILSRAWVGEDALITFRTIENLTHGDGPRWNPDERVQTFTHPLWMLLNAAAYAVTREIYTTTTVLGLACSLGAYALLARRHANRPLVLLLAVFLPWCASSSLVRYGTSGYENPLTLLLLALFSVAWLGAPRAAALPWLRLALLASLLALNRLDTILLALPALAWAGATARPVPSRSVLLGGAPLLAWLGFALFYYGFALPNTAPAKLSGAVPFSEYARHGLAYLADLPQSDLPSAVLLCLGAGVALHGAARFARDRGDEKAARLAALGLGMAPYAAYVIAVGGGFLSGRFWAAPVFLSIVLVAERAEDAWAALGRLNPVRRAAVALAACAGVLALAAFARHAETWTRAAGILELPFARAELGRDLRWEVSELGWRFREQGLEARRAALHREGRKVAVLSAVGFAGLASGRDVTIIDRWALTDPLLARLSPAAGEELRIGHLVRELPAGYETVRATGSLEALHPALREYYRRLRLVVAGPLWSRERLAAIAGFHLGRYDAWLREYERETGRAAGVRSLGAWPARDRERR